ncbi:coiled-coil domain-containing protein 1-like [Medicago truncatula]|uniref:coiled-coil domain-containing protein 1-like n=1 Tax=Medicago truncatula TaxID=3880 RepID=UPI00196858E7|nr:coiled-coil domain-containing protein 1-like [Medicago truncatula]
MTERLKHRPPKVPIAHFRALCEFWSKEPIQALAESNARNRAQLKWLHRMGPQNFSLTREKLREKEKREPTQSEMFFETRKGSRGKQLDEETGKVFSQLQEMVEKKGSDTEAFKAVMGKERPGRLRCYGRTVTKTSLKRKVEINALKQAHSQEVSILRHEFQDQIDRLQNAFKTVIQQCNPQLNMASIEHLLGLSHGDANSSPKDSGAQMHSSTSIHTPCPEKQVINEDAVQDDIDEEEDVDDEFLEDEFLEDNLSDEFQEDDIDDEFEEDDIDDEFQEDDLDDEIQENDIGDEFEVDDLADELQDKLE